MTTEQSTRAPLDEQPRINTPHPEILNTPYAQLATLDLQGFEDFLARITAHARGSLELVNWQKFGTVGNITPDEGQAMMYMALIKSGYKLSSFDDFRASDLSDEIPWIRAPAILLTLRSGLRERHNLLEFFLSAHKSNRVAIFNEDEGRELAPGQNRRGPSARHGKVKL